MHRNLLCVLDRRTVLARLENEVAKGASFDSHAEEHNRTCLPNTRVELLQQILEWALDPGAEAVFWLNGMAGTGKSTISRTVAQTFSGAGHLGATFFFKRGESDRANMSKFVSSIAADLAKKVPATARHIKEVFSVEPSETLPDNDRFRRIGKKNHSTGFRGQLRDMTSSNHPSFLFLHWCLPCPRQNNCS